MLYLDSNTAYKERMKELLMGNEAIALGVMATGVKVVAGYPGTPSTEVLETIAKRNPGNIYVEWSTNEKAGMEVAAGAAFSGCRSLVTMKQMGLNVASDPAMCLSYMGIKGGMVIFVADDPGPISSQTEQDTRQYGMFSKIPVLECYSPEQAFIQAQEAFALSEKYSIPVILRGTTRVCHSCAVIDVPEIPDDNIRGYFEKDSRWVIFPKLSYENKKRLVKQEKIIAQEFSEMAASNIEGEGSIGIACGGICYSYVKDAIAGYEENFTVWNVTTPYPFPEDAAANFLKSVDEVYVFEELDPYIEDRLIYTCGNKEIRQTIKGKRTGDVPVAGELDAVSVASTLAKATGIDMEIMCNEPGDLPELPVRPPVLCAGCPHRGAFYSVKQATKGKKAVFCGDIGCYTLGNAQPLDMVDTCLCMGGGITMAQGIAHADRDALVFAFVGDSTFFASGITGVVNAVYNQTDMILVVLDNSTTAMTGHQPHPGIGLTMMGKQGKPVSIEKVLEGIGLKSIRTVNPLDLKASKSAVESAVSEYGVRAIIFKSPCIAITKPLGNAGVDEKSCIGCMKCINELGCTALIPKDGKAFIDNSLCTGCGLCSQVCAVNCINITKEEV